MEAENSQKNLINELSRKPLKYRHLGILSVGRKDAFTPIRNKEKVLLNPTEGKEAGGAREGRAAQTARKPQQMH